MRRWTSTWINRTPPAGGGGDARYRSDIDGLRALACLAVVLYHCFPRCLPGGFSGVDVFFVISGYLISLILYRGLFAPEHKLNLLDFYVRRVRRIFPALIAVLGFCLAAGLVTQFPEEYVLLGRHVTGGAAYVSNIFYYQEFGAYFTSAAVEKPLLHLWSLGVEEQFYLVFPVLLWLVYKANVNFLLFLAALTLLSFFLNKNGIRHGDAAAVFFLPWYRLWELTAGALIAYLAMFFNKPLKDCGERLGRALTGALTRERGNFSLRADHCLSVGGAALLLFGFITIEDYKHYPGTDALIPVAGALMLIGAGRDGVVNRRILSNRFMVFLGLISYPLYLWHWPLLSFASLLCGDTPPVTARVGVILLALFLAILTWHFVEGPLRFGPRPKFKAAVLFIALCAVGLAGAAVTQDTVRPQSFYAGERPAGSEEAKKRLARKNARCLRSEPAWAIGGVDNRIYGSCYLEPEDGRPKLYALGDSTIGQLRLALEEWAYGRSVGLNLFSAQKQVPFAGFQAGWRVSNRLARDMYLIKGPLLTKAIEGFLADDTAALALLSYRPAGAREGLRDMADPNKIKEWNRKNFQALEELYEQGARRTFELFQRRGKLALMVLNQPETKWKTLFKCKAALRPGGSGDASVCLEGRAFDDNPYVLAFNQAVKDAAADYPNVEIIDISEAFCGSENCRLQDGGMPLYRDPQHLNEHGARAVLRLLSVRMEDLLAKPRP